MTDNAETALSIHGVPGRRFARHAWSHAPELWASQTWKSEARPAPKYGDAARMTVEMRFDDNCKNGHNTFAITGSVYDPTIRGRDKFVAGGCLHDDIEKLFPELASFIPWHLCSQDGPMHYVANTVYLAGDRDHWGKRAGEPRAFSTFVAFGKNPILHAPGGHRSAKFMAFLEAATPHNGRGAYDFEVIGLDHKDRKTYGTKYTFGGFGDDWYECPFNSEDEALRFLQALQTCNPRFVRVASAWGEGKARELDAARRAAIWPDATDATLSLPPEDLRPLLEARLPALLREFREEMQGSGFAWSAE